VDPGGIDSTMCSRALGVAGAPPGAPSTNWKWRGGSNSPSSRSRRQLPIMPVSKISSSGLVPTSAIRRARSLRNSGGFRNTPSPTFRLPASKLASSGRNRRGMNRAS